MREATQQLQTEVERREEAVKQRERMHKEKMRLQTSRRSGKVNRIVCYVYISCNATASDTCATLYSVLYCTSFSTMVHGVIHQKA